MVGTDTLRQQLFETIAFAFSIMGVVASVSSTMSFPLVSGGSCSVTPRWGLFVGPFRLTCMTSFAIGGHVGMIFGWLIPSLFVMTIAASLAELTSAMPYVPFSTNFDR